MRTAVAVFILVSSVLSAEAQDRKTDPRAFEECKKQSATFVQVEECLPEAHVAFVAMDAFEEIYPDAARPLKARCLELNDSTRGAFTCVRTAIDSAISLSQSLPEGASIDNPVFGSVSSETMHQQFQAEIEKARATFPDQMIWGGGVYTPYR